MINITQIQHAQTVLIIEDILAMKKKSGESTTQEALSRAVEHYLICKEELMHHTLAAARDYITAKKDKGATDILKLIDNVLRPRVEEDE